MLLLPRPGRNFTKNAHSGISFKLLGLAGIALALLPGCTKSKPALSPQSESSPKVSSIRVNVSNERIEIQSPVAEFDLSSTGYLKAVLKREGRSFTLDDPGNQAGQHIMADGKRTGDFSLDLVHASISDATGKIGRLGKHIEIAGTSPTSKLAETMTVEVYDDFPGMAFLSASFRNIDSREIQLDSVTLQEHHLNASLSDPQAVAHDMWSFFGSSLKWGKDEVLRMPANFSQENPFSLPIAVDGDLGGAGGGIPVVAFWARNVGTAIGHIETLPLVLSIPVLTSRVQSRAGGPVSASVQIPASVSLKSGEIYSTPRTFLAVYSGIQGRLLPATHPMVAGPRTRRSVKSQAQR